MKCKYKGTVFCQKKTHEQEEKKASFHISVTSVVLGDEFRQETRLESALCTN